MASDWIERDEHGFKAVVRLPDGRRRSKRFAFSKYGGVRSAERAAKGWCRDIVLTVQRGTFVDPHHGRVRYGDWARTFRANDALRLRRTTAALNAVALDRHILPTFGDTPLAKITQPLVQAWISDLSKRGLSGSTVKQYYLVLRKSLDAAVAAGLIRQSPCVGISLPPVNAEEMRFLTPSELARLADAVDSRNRALIFVAGYSGLRIGELAALQRRNINPEESVIAVRAGLTDVRGHLEVGPPKTRAAVRRVPIPAEVSRVVEQHIVQFGLADPDAFIFQGRSGGLLRPSAWRSRVFAPAVERAGLAPLRPHDLRHTAIAIWIAAGVQPKEIAVRAGHTSTAFVLDRYGHLFPDSEEAFRDRVSRMFET